MKPSRKDIIKTIVVIAITILAVVLAFGVTIFNADIINKIVAALTAVGALWLWSLDNSQTIFLTWNTIKMKLSRDPVTWESINTFYVDEDFDFTTYCRNYLNRLNKKSTEYKEVRQSSTDFFIEQTIVKNPQTIKIYSSDKDDVLQLKFKRISKTTYKHSLDEYADFLDIVHKFKKYLQQEEGSQYYLGKDEIYSFNLQFEKSNPFYHLMVRHVDNSAIEKFNLNFKDGNVDVKISKNTITLTSCDQKQIQAALQNYLAVSDNN